MAKAKFAGVLGSSLQIATGEEALRLLLSKSRDKTDRIHVDLSTSCTRDVAVAKLLGWMREPFRRINLDLDIDDDDISLDHVAYIYELGRPLEELLTQFRENAQRRHFEAFEAGASEEAMATRSAEVALCDETIYKAARYMRDIDEELNKVAKRALQLDAHLTAKSGEPHITLSSLNSWSMNKYGIAVVEESSSAGAKVQNEEKYPAQIQNKESAFNEDWLSRPQETAYASFGFLMAALAANRPKCRSGNSLNPNGIAEMIALQMGNHLEEKLTGQAAETMRKTFARSIKAMDEKLKALGINHEAYLQKLVAVHAGRQLAG